MFSLYLFRFAFILWHYIINFFLHYLHIFGELRRIAVYFHFSFQLIGACFYRHTGAVKAKGEQHLFS